MTEGSAPINPVVNMHGYCTDLSTMSYNEACGLTKREFFSAMAMNGYCAFQYTPHHNAEYIANYSVELADALIERLNKET